MTKSGMHSHAGAWERDLGVMPKYEAYKDSGVEWLGDIPDGWGIERIKYLFSEVNERSNNGEEELLSVSQYTGVTKKVNLQDYGIPCVNYGDIHSKYGCTSFPCSAWERLRNLEACR